MNESPHVPSRTTNDASVKVHLMTGFRRSKRSSDHSKHKMLTCRTVVGPPVPAPDSRFLCELRNTSPLTMGDLFCSHRRSKRHGDQPSNQTTSHQAQHPMLIMGNMSLIIRWRTSDGLFEMTSVDIHNSSLKPFQLLTNIDLTHGNEGRSPMTSRELHACQLGR